MSYRDPQQAIADKYAIMKGHRDNMMKLISGGTELIGGNLKEMAALKAKRKQKIEKKYSKRMKTYEESEADIRKDLYSKGPQDPKDAESYRAIIERELLVIRNGMAVELKNVDLTNSQVNEIQTLGLVDLNNFQTAVLTADEINSEEKEFGDLKPYEENALMDGKNDDALYIAGAINEGQKFDFYNLNNLDPDNPYKVGRGRWGLSLINEDGGYSAESTIDVNEVAERKKPGEMWYNHSTSSESKAFKKPIADLNKYLVKLGLDKDDERFQTNGKADPELLKKYLSEDAAGQKLVSDIFEDEQETRAYLRSKAPKDTNDYIEYDKASMEDKDRLAGVLVEDAFFTVPSDQIFREDVVIEDVPIKHTKEGELQEEKVITSGESPASDVPDKGEVRFAGGTQKLTGTEDPEIIPSSDKEFNETWAKAKKGDVVKGRDGKPYEKT